MKNVWLTIFIIIFVLMACLFGGSMIAADEMARPAVVYQEYGGIWYEFRYDWHDYRDTPEDWESLGELKAWLAYDSTPLVLLADKNGVINFNGQCEDVAFQARSRAYAVGKWLDTEILTRLECIQFDRYLAFDPYEMGPNDGHYLNKAVIGNAIYYVDSGSDTVWLAYYLD
jgi:hypothetical protein